MNKKLIPLFVKRFNIPEEVLAEELVVPDGVSEEDYIESLLTGYETERFEFAKSKYLNPLVAEAVRLKSEEMYPATVKPIMNKVHKLFELDKVENEDPKAMIERLHGVFQERLAEASKKVNPDTAEMTRSLNEYKAKVTQLTGEIESIKEDHAIAINKEKLKAEETANKYLLDKLYADEFRSVEEKLAVPGLAYPLRSDLEKRGYVLELDSSGAEPKLIVKASDGTKPMNLAKTKNIETFSEVALEIANANNWVKRNNNDKVDDKKDLKNETISEQGNDAVDALDDFFGK